MLSPKTMNLPRKIDHPFPIKPPIPKKIPPSVKLLKCGITFHYNFFCIFLLLSFNFIFAFIFFMQEMTLKKYHIYLHNTICDCFYFQSNYKLGFLTIGYLEPYHCQYHYQIIVITMTIIMTDIIISILINVTKKRLFQSIISNYDLERMILLLLFA